MNISSRGVRPAKWQFWFRVVPASCWHGVSLHLVCGRSSLLQDRHLTLPDAGVGLLDLPLEVLHAIFSHFQAHEWAKGPANSCLFLNRIDLSRLALRLPVRFQAVLATFEAPGLPVRTCASI